MYLLFIFFFLICLEGDNSVISEEVDEDKKMVSDDSIQDIKLTLC